MELRAASATPLTLCDMPAQPLGNRAEATANEMMLLAIYRIVEKPFPLPSTQEGITKTFSLWNVATQSVRSFPDTYK
jgi:hypothetical protein